MRARRASPEDVPQLVQLIIRAHASYRARIPYTRTLRKLHEALGSVATVILVVEDGGRLVGFAWGEVREEGDFFIHHLYAPGCINVLADAIIVEARKSGCSRIAGITTRPPRGWARKFGAKVVGYLMVKEV